MDRVGKETRSLNMRAVRSHDTRPERLVRSAAHRAGYRFRLHDVRLPGKPDLVFPRYKLVIFVHGCFWHRHSCRKGKMPETNLTFWCDKLSANVARDARNAEQLADLGWTVATIWECKVGSLDEAANLLARVLPSRSTACDFR